MNTLFFHLGCGQSSCNKDSNNKSAVWAKVKNCMMLYNSFQRLPFPVCNNKWLEMGLGTLRPGDISLYTVCIAENGERSVFILC